MKRLQIAGVILATIVAIGLAVYFNATTATPEPQYQGQTLTQWLEQGMAASGKFNDKKEAERDPAFLACKLAVNHIGTNALPFLFEDLLCQKSKIKSAVGHLATRPFIRPVLKQKWLDQLGAFAETGDERILLRQTRGYFGFYLLAENADDARPRLLELIKETKDHRRFFLILSYGATKPPKEELVPLAVQWMKSTDMVTSLSGEGILRHYYPDEITNKFSP